MAGDSCSMTWSTIWSLLPLKVGSEGWGAKELGLGNSQKHKGGEDNLRNREGDKQ